LLGYALAPDPSLTGIVGEIHAALAWLAADGPAHGINGKIVLSRCPAGGHLAAMCLDHPLVTGGLAISGVVELGMIRDTYLNEKLRLTDEGIVRLFGLIVGCKPWPGTGTWQRGRFLSAAMLLAYNTVRMQAVAAKTDGSGRQEGGISCE
jgi:hypothetical protein